MRNKNWLNDWGDRMKCEEIKKEMKKYKNTEADSRKGKEDRRRGTESLRV